MLATRNVRLMLAFRGTTRAIMFAPYIAVFMVGVRGLSWTQYGAMQLIYYWVVMAFEVPSGVIADRLGRKTTLVLGAAVNAIGCFLFASAHDLATFAAGEVFFALGTALISGADSAMIFDSLAAEGREAEYPRAEGATQAVWLGATAIGLPLTDLFLVRDGDPVLAYWLTGALSILGIVAALAMKEPPVGKRLSTRDITVGAIREVLHRAPIRRIILYSVGVFILLRAAIVIFFNPVLAASGVPINRFGTVLAGVNVVGVVTAVTAHRLLGRFGERAALVAMPVALLVMFAFLAVVRVPAVAAVFCLQGAVFGAYPLIVRPILNRHVSSSARRATTISLESMACRIAFGFVVAGAGYSMDLLSLEITIALTAALGCLPLVALLATGRRSLP